jgi:hypothetical protein
MEQQAQAGVEIPITTTECINNRIDDKYCDKTDDSSEAASKVEAKKIEIQLNVTFDRTIENFGFDNLSKECLIEMFKDGRSFSLVIEPWLEQNYDALKHIKGCQGHDLVNISDENIKYEQKTFTKYGCIFTPSNMKGEGRKFNQHMFEEKTRKLIFIIVSNIDFPNIKIKFISGNDLILGYPKGKIPFKDFDKFFNYTPSENKNETPPPPVEL